MSANSAPAGKPILRMLAQRSSLGFQSATMNLR